MRRAILPMLVVCCGVASAQDTPKPDLSGIASNLRSTERDRRFEALEQVEAMREVSAELLEPLVSFVKREAEYSLIPDMEKTAGTKIDSVTLTGEEVSLVRIKGNPQDYTGKDFILCGGVATSNYYNFGYSNASPTHYSYRFFQVDKDGKVASNESADLYLPKAIGKAFAEDVTQVMEQGADAKLVRLRCHVDPERVGTNHERILSMIEVRDWQFQGRTGGWKPWAFDGIRRGYGQVARIGMPAATKLTEVVLADLVYQNEGADDLLRAGAALALMRMDLDARRLAYALLQKGALNSNLRKARDWANRLCGELLSGDEKVASRPQAKPVDPSVRAATALRSAQNLEKAQKIPGALGLYRGIVRDYPGTRQAKSAEERIRILGGK
jgi:hypothetical protein